MVASLLETILITNLLVGSSNFQRVRVLVLRLMGTLICLPQKPRENTVILNPVAEGVKVFHLVMVESHVQLEEPGEKEPEAGYPALAGLRKLGKDLQAIRL
ncbi:unnamed protein product [Coregonus sp. 'balchen']|nr:unnamed protein product [Coregonus sp. 'balchen']